ncbi:MAG: hypothetical protein KM312_04995 [Hydrogenibacillus schlegelii]|uniref:Uncharacterized protein n=1 Tax=Hydrogenibacillus schlegelii TaxID=1484 RepID=A0A947CVX1_HYDSH|nr:hypothetical protein [Hydrogenibacillus schlegelii]
MTGGIEVEGIQVINIPHERDEYDAYFPDFLLEVAEKYASRIPERLRPAIILDFDHVPDEELIAWGEAQRKPLSEAELKLIAALEELEKNGWQFGDGKTNKEGEKDGSIIQRP